MLFSIKVTEKIADITTLVVLEYKNEKNKKIKNNIYQCVYTCMLLLKNHFSPPDDEWECSVKEEIKKNIEDGMSGYIWWSTG